MTFLIFLLIVAISSTTAAGTFNNIICPFQRIYQFGDSLSDTGNFIRILPFGPLLPAARLPYGETFPGSPTGRWSDGALVIDFTARRLGLPLLNPYLNPNASFGKGANFAVAGSTALDPFFLAERGVIVPPGTVPLRGQLNWFRTILNSTCSSPTDCANKIRRSLIFMGEIGGNDINYAIAQGKSLQEIQTYIPFINQAIVNATREVIRSGARRIVVPGNFPIGCIPFFLSALSSNDSTAYDNFGCLISANNLAIFQNDNLKASLDSLRREFPNVVILYADFYSAFQSILREAQILGIDRATLLKPCCGTEGPYNPLSPTFCGNPGVPVCPDPNKYLHWDGLHLTQKAYGRISEIVLKNVLLKIRCIQ